MSIRQLRHALCALIVLLFACANNTAHAQTIALQARREFVVGRNPSAVAVSDLNHDGKLDLVSANASTDNLSVLLGNGDGTFRPALNRSVGNGDGSFQTPRNYPTGADPAALAVGDFNNDGRQDLAVANNNSNSVSLFLGNSDGQLRTLANPFAVNGAPRSIALGDFDGDGSSDLVTGNANATVSILRGVGDGNFQTALPLQLAGGATLAVAVSDFNRDGAPDIAATSSGSTAGRLWLGNGRGNFSTGGNFTLEFALSTFASSSLLTGDFNRDGNPDLALANGENLANDNLQSLSVWAGRGDSTFQPAALFGVDGNAYTLTDGDFDRDGKLDLAVLFAGESTAANAAALLLNQTLTAARSLAAVSAASFQTTALASETIVAAFGAELATRVQAAPGLPLPTALAGSMVRVTDSSGLARLAPLFFVAPAQINFLMPPGLALGTATVTVLSGAGSPASGTIQITAVAPGLFAANANGQGVAAALVLRVKDGAQSIEPVARFDPAQNRFVPAPIDLGVETDQPFLILFGTGFRGRSLLNPVSCLIGGVNAEVLFAGAQGELAGLDQANLRLPRSLAGRGEVEVRLTVDGKAANVVHIAVR